MHRQSMMFLLVLAALAALAVYEAMVPLPASTVFTRYLGIGSFFLLCVSLAIGPLSILSHKHFANLIEPRRAIGLAAFALVVGHVILAAGSEYGWQIGVMLSILPIQLSVPAAFLMMMLALTSSDYAVKTLGPALWKRVQMLNYVVFPLAFGHFLLSATGLFVQTAGGLFVNLAELSALIMGIAVVILQAWGFAARRRRKDEWEAKNAQAKQASGGGSPP
jgi:DMSO/TMAO reductase YedYZ heme-binding membrane subunit